MAEKDAKPKKQSTIKQIIQIYKYTAKEDKALPWLEAGAFLLPVQTRSATSRSTASPAPQSAC